jgi:hypothetical protein
MDTIYYVSTKILFVLNFQDFVILNKEINELIILVLRFSENWGNRFIYIVQGRSQLWVST